MCRGDRPRKLYAVETAIQLTLAELNENRVNNLRGGAHAAGKFGNHPQDDGRDACTVFSARICPGYSVSDFYESDIGSGGDYAGYMARPCDVYFTLERKLERFLQPTLRIYCVPEEKQREVMALIASLDIRAIANEVMQKLFAALEMHYEFTLGEEAKQI